MKQKSELLRVVKAKRNIGVMLDPPAIIPMVLTSPGWYLNDPTLGKHYFNIESHNAYHEYMYIFY
jgi:hypothetical protein